MIPTSHSSQTSIPVGSFPAAPGAARILLFGGSFDPPHRGHIDLPLAARDSVGADWLMYIPAARSPFKDAAPTASASDRVAMLVAALEETRADRVGVATLELDRGDTAPSYTIDSLRAIREHVANDVILRLLIGADQARDFHRWREAHEIIKAAEPVVMLRHDDDRAALIEALQAHWDQQEMARWQARIVPLPKVYASSSDIRRVLAEQGPDAPDLADQSPRSVLSYIRARGLYASRSQSRPES